MGLLNFFKKKRNKKTELIDKLIGSFFPKGEKDIESGTNELLYILDYSIDAKTAKLIFVKSVAISRVSEKFNKERLRAHLAGYALKYFNEAQIDQFYGYLVALSSAILIHQKTPSEVRRDGSNYIW